MSQRPAGIHDCQTPPADGAILQLARKQHGVVSAAQLREAGFDRPAVRRWLRAGHLQSLHRGVFAVAAVSRDATAPQAEMAALLACGRARSVISHRSAARLWDLPVDRLEIVIDVSVLGEPPRRRPGIRIHRATGLDRRDVRHISGVRATAPARTLLDLAAVLSFDDLEIAYAEARGRRLMQQRDISVLLERNVGRRGTTALRRLVEFDRDHRLSRSHAERSFLAMVRSAGLTLPKANALVDGFQVDFFWPDPRLIVEIDGYAAHGSRNAFERDRERDAKLNALGYVVMRVTWQHLVAHRDAVVARVAGALAVRDA